MKKTTKSVIGLVAAVVIGGAVAVVCEPAGIAVGFLVYGIFSL